MGHATKCVPILTYTYDTATSLIIIIIMMFECRGKTENKCKASVLRIIIILLCRHASWPLEEQRSGWFQTATARQGDCYICVLAIPVFGQFLSDISFNALILLVG